VRIDSLADNSFVSRGQEKHKLLLENRNRTIHERLQDEIIAILIYIIIIVVIIIIIIIIR
jgi:lipopolysaccharide/colanic/teichoic acid biosynthesis glycosyltransferase